MTMTALRACNRREKKGNQERTMTANATETPERVPRHLCPPERVEILGAAG